MLEMSGWANDLCVLCIADTCFDTLQVDFEPSRIHCTHLAGLVSLTGGAAFIVEFACVVFHHIMSCTNVEVAQTRTRHQCLLEFGGWARRPPSWHRSLPELSRLSPVTDTAAAILWSRPVSASHNHLPDVAVNWPVGWESEWKVRFWWSFRRPARCI